MGLVPAFITSRKVLLGVPTSHLGFTWKNTAIRFHGKMLDTAVVEENAEKNLNAYKPCNALSIHPHSRGNCDDTLSKCLVR